MKSPICGVETLDDILQYTNLDVTDIENGFKDNFVENFFYERFQEEIPDWIDYLFNGDDDINTMGSTLMELFLGRNADKKMSSTYWAVYKYSANKDCAIAFNTLLVDALFKFSEKWIRVAKTLFADYNPLENYSMNDRITLAKTGVDSLTHGKVLSKTGSDSLTYGKVLKKTGTDVLDHDGSVTHGESVSDATMGTDDTTETPRVGRVTKVKTNIDTTSVASGSTERQVSAFDSSTYEPKEKSINNDLTTRNTGNATNNYTETEEQTPTGTNTKSESRSESKTQVHSGTDYDTTDETRTLDLIDAESGNDARTLNLTDTESGTDTNQHASNETQEHTRSGNIGVTTSQQMAQSEFELRAKNNFFEVFFSDIESLMFLGVY